MFIGEYQHSIDDKGRLAVPAKFRALLKGGAVVTKGLDNCLFLYPKKEWQKLAIKLGNMPVGRANSRALSRFMLAGAMEADFDSQGRIVVPEYLRQFAGIKKKTVIAGLYDRLEIWDEAAWQKFKVGVDAKSGDIAEALSELNI